jgi:hypothetical protein
MKTKITKEEAAAPPPKGKVKIKNLKITKETTGNLSDQDATAIKGGGWTSTNHNHSETLLCDED